MGLIHVGHYLNASVAKTRGAVGFRRMDDKSLPHGGIPVPVDPQGADAAVADRRAFFRRAVAVGIPVVLATVRSRTVHAETLSGCASCQPSPS